MWKAIPTVLSALALTLLPTGAVLLTLPTAAYSQSVVTGDIAGSVIDPSKAVIPNAKVLLHSDATGSDQTVSTNTEGQFRLSLLRPGVYTLTVKAPGFADTTTQVAVNLGQVTPVTVTAGLQKQTTTVSVTEETPLLNNENANLATTFNTLQLENLPNPGNDMTAYAYTAPGVTVSTGGGYGNFSVFGLPADSNLFTINGADNMDPYLNLNNSGASNLTLGANEISEAAVVINGYTGQYGRQSGAQVNYVTKSGTNAFHGNVGGYYNEKLLNANDWFNNASIYGNPSSPRPFAISRSWIGSVGGPVIKNKLFFYVDNEGLRYVLPGGGPVYIPTTDFSTFVLNNVKQVTPSAAPIYTTALNLFGGASGAASATPVPITADDPGGCGDFADPVSGFGIRKPCARVFRSTVNNLNTEWLMAVRGDYNISSKDRFYMRYNTDHGVQATGTDPINPIFNANSVQPSYGGQVGYTRIIGATMVNDLRLAGSWYSALFGPPDLAASLAAFPTTWTFGDGDDNNVGGGNNVYPQGRKVGQAQVIDDFSWVKGKHELKFGLNYRYNHVSDFSYGPGTSGLLTFNSMTDFVNGSLDNGSTYSQTFASVGAEPLRLYSAGFYAQDTWRISPKATATLALRFDRNSNISCKFNCFAELGTSFPAANHDVTQPYNAVIKTGLNQAFTSVEPVVASPRFGLAYNLDSKTVIRGGVGLFTDLYQGLIAARFITNAPQVASFTASSGTAARSGGTSALAAVTNSYNAFATGFAGGATLAKLQAAVPGFSVPNFNTLDGQLVNPKYIEWNLEVQRAISKDYSLSVNYVGNKGYDEFIQSVFGNAWAANGFGGLPTKVTDARFGEIRSLGNNAYSGYNGLVSSFKWRVGGQFQGSFNYIWSHAIDLVSNGGLEPFNALTSVSVRYQLSPLGIDALNRGSADYDVRHSISANYIYTVRTKFHNPVLNGILSGWNIGGTSLFHSGYPFSIVNTGVRSTQGLKNASGIATQITLSQWLGAGAPPSCTYPSEGGCYTAAQFISKSKQSTFGPTGRNTFRGPGYFNSDLNVNKTFNVVSERYKLMIGASFLNIFNHPNFDLPVNNLASGTFGTIQSTVSAPTSAYGSFQGSAVSGRIIQFVTKFSF